MTWAPSKPRRHPRRVPRHRISPKTIPSAAGYVPRPALRHRRPPVMVRKIRPKMPSLVPGVVAVLDFLQYPAGAVTQYTPTFSSYHSDYAAFVVVLKPVI